MERRALKGLSSKAAHAFKCSPIVRVDVTLEELQKKKGRNGSVNLRKMSQMAEDRLADKAPLAFTTIYVDKDGVFLAVYLGYRWLDQPEVCV